MPLNGNVRIDVFFLSSASIRSVVFLVICLFHLIFKIYWC